MVEIMFSRVDLPHPDGPMTAQKLPRGRRKLTPSTAGASAPPP